MLQTLVSYFANVRVIEKNVAAAARFSIESRQQVAEQMVINQRLISTIEAGGIKGAPLDDAAIECLLTRSFHNCTKMGAQAAALGGRNRRDPFLNLASTLQGLYTETIVARHRPSHKKFITRINSIIERFTHENLTDTKRAELDANLQILLREMIQSLPPHGANERIS